MIQPSSSYFSMDDYDFIKFEKAKAKNKKYSAIIKNKKTKRNKTVPFGDARYEQYQDSTGLGLYSSKDHKDPKRRESYKKRHMTYIKKGFYSPGYFSLKYLW